jgi:hypothetical protein
MFCFHRITEPCQVPVFDPHNVFVNRNVCKDVQDQAGRRASYKVEVEGRLEPDKSKKPTSIPRQSGGRKRSKKSRS